jgi:intracellular multiplication protein IcmL
MKKKQNEESGLTLVLERNAFYCDGYKKMLIAIFFLLGVNALLIGGIVYKLWNPPAPQYFAANADGKIISFRPLSDPAVTDDFVAQWSANAVRKAFSLDFMHWRAQLQEASSDFTPQGWQYFVTALKQSNNLKTLTDLKMVSDAQITSAPQIVEKELLGSVYAWKVEMSVLVTFSNSNEAQKIQMPMKVTLIVLREPVQNYPDQIAINNFLPEVQKTAAQELETSGI